MGGVTKTNLLIEIMGSSTWDIVSLREAYNNRRKRGICTRELSARLSKHKQFEIVGETSILTGWVRQSPKNGYKLYRVKDEFQEVIS